MKAWFELDFGMAWQHWDSPLLLGPQRMFTPMLYGAGFRMPAEFMGVGRMYHRDSMLGDSYARAITYAILGFSPEIVAVTGGSH